MKKKYNAARNKFWKLNDDYQDLYDQYKIQLKELERDKSDLLIDMEEQIGAALEASNQKETPAIVKLQNKYGKKLNDIDTEIEQLRAPTLAKQKEISAAEKIADELNAKLKSLMDNAIKAIKGN